MADMEIEDAAGNRVTVTEAHWKKYPQLKEKFKPVKRAKTARKKPAPKSLRPVADVTTAPAVTNPPTGDEEKE